MDGGGGGGGAGGAGVWRDFAPDEFPYTERSDAKGDPLNETGTHGVSGAASGSGDKLVTFYKMVKTFG